MPPFQVQRQPTVEQILQRWNVLDVRRHALMDLECESLMAAAEGDVDALQTMMQVRQTALDIHEEMMTLLTELAALRGVPMRALAAAVAA